MTPFPSRASEVVALTVPEFTCELDLNAAGAFEGVCQRFLEDANPSAGVVHPLPRAEFLV
jgi:hypothetical protein